MTLLALVSIFVAVPLAAMFFLFRNSPEGYEDRSGFHFMERGPASRNVDARPESTGSDNWGSE